MKRAIAFVACAVLLAACGKSADQTVRDVASSAPAAAAKDSFLAAAIKARVTAIDIDSARDVHVRAQGSHVTISGVVREMAKKEAMIKAAKEVPGVEVVTDELTVNPRAPRATKDLADAALVARVATALAAQTGVNALRLHVRAHDGAVTIEGTAPTAAIKETILTTARKVSDVRHVTDNIRIAP